MGQMGKDSGAGRDESVKEVSVPMLSNALIERSTIIQACCSLSADVKL